MFLLGSLLFLSCSHKENKEAGKPRDQITKIQLPISGMVNPEKYTTLLGDWTLVKMVINKKFKEETSLVKDTAIPVHISEEGIFSDKGIQLGKSDKEYSMVFNLTLDTLKGKYLVMAKAKNPVFFKLQGRRIEYVRRDSVIGYITTQLYFIRRK